MKKLLLSLLLALPVVAAADDAPDIITQQPAGDLLTYERSGYAWYDAGSSNVRGLQTGTIDVVFAADSKVYFKQPLSKLQTDAWIVGTLDAAGTTITVELGQCLGFNEDKTDFVVIKMMEFDEDYEEFSAMNNIKTVTYTVAADRQKITLNGTSKDYALGAVWTSNDEWTGYCDYASVYTLAEELEEVVPPTGLVTEKYQITANGYVAAKEVTYPVSIGFDGDDIYIKGVFSDMADAWIKGTKQADGSYSFASGQYLGQYNKRDYFCLSTMTSDTHTTTPFILKWNEAAGQYENSDQFLIQSGHRLQVYLTEALSSIKLKKMANEGIVFTVPYLDKFETQAGFTNYTVIDGNYDGHSWYYNPSMMRVCYDSMFTKDGGDDWLITPAIELEGGIPYIFTVAARSFTSSLPEELDVSVGTEATAEAMTTTVIPTTEVATGDFTPFSGNFTPKKSGKYYFGVHATTKTDQMTLYVNRISVEVDKTGVEGITIDADNEPQLIYTLDGRKVLRADRPGIYIINGKKTIIR